MYCKLSYNTSVVVTIDPLAFWRREGLIAAWAFQGSTMIPITLACLASTVLLGTVLYLCRCGSPKKLASTLSHKH